MKTQLLTNHSTNLELERHASVETGETGSPGESPTLEATRPGDRPPSTTDVDWLRAVAKQVWNDVAKAPKTAPTIPGFEDFQEIDRGGMGIVYKGHQPGVNRTVALKMLVGGEHSTPNARSRLQVEAQAIGRLHHPNIIQIYQVGEIDGQPYLVLEYAPKGSLAIRLTTGPLPSKEAAELSETLARAIHAAHRAGVVHRDLKPANVLYAEDGSPKIADFGLAKITLREGVTEHDEILGTVQYMAPEQAAGKPAGHRPTSMRWGGFCTHCSLENRRSREQRGSRLRTKFVTKIPRRRES